MFLTRRLLHRAIVGLGLGFLLTSPHPVMAQTITFEDLSGGVPFSSSGHVILYSYNAPINEQGFTFSNGPSVTFGVWTPDAPTYYGGNYTGSEALFEDGGGGDSISLTKQGGGAFTLNSIDIANNYLQSFSPGSAPINFVGTKEGGGTVTFTYSPPVDNNLHTVTFSNFTDVVSVTWQQNFPYHQFDNVVLNGGVSETPEPGKLALLTGAGLTGMAFVNRRRSKKENLKCATIR